MKVIPEIKEQNRLALTFQYLELFPIPQLKKPNADSPLFLSCEAYQTDFHNRERPVKPLVRMI